MEEWAYFVEAFTKVKEGDGTLLDNMLIYATTDSNWARIHSIDGMPMFTAGRAGGRVKTGLHVDGGGTAATRVGYTAMKVLRRGRRLVGQQEQQHFEGSLGDPRVRRAIRARRRPLPSGSPPRCCPQPRRAPARPNPTSPKRCRPGFRVETSELDGPVFADAKGRTLYRWPFRTMRNGVTGDGKGESNCTDIASTESAGLMSPYPGRPAAAGTRIAARAASRCGHRRSLRRRPRRSASGRWSSAATAAGNGPTTDPSLYTSIRDRRPGDVLGGDSYRRDGDAPAVREPVQPKPDVPPGLAVTHHAARPPAAHDARASRSMPSTATRATQSGLRCRLRAGSSSPCRRRRPHARTATGPSSARASGERQWMFRGKPLYVYAEDSRVRSLAGSDVPGWRNVYTQEAPPPPAEFTVQDTPSGQVLADARGRTVYSYTCGDDAPDQLSCEHPADTQVYRLAMCGGGSAERCARNFPYVEASRDARSSGRLWSVVEIDPATGHFAAAGQPRRVARLGLSRAPGVHLRRRRAAGRSQRRRAGRVPVGPRRIPGILVARRILRRECIDEPTRMALACGERNCWQRRRRAPPTDTAPEGRTIAYVVTNLSWALQSTPGDDRMPARPQRRRSRAVQAAVPRSPTASKRAVRRHPAAAPGRELPPDGRAGRAALPRGRRARSRRAWTWTARTDPRTSPARTARRGIDNQMHRVLGCIANYRAPDGPIRFFEDEMILRENYNRIIVQLTGVDSLVDDPAVDVMIFRGRDKVVVDAGGLKALPGGTQRIDTRWGSRYHPAHARAHREGRADDRAGRPAVPVGRVLHADRPVHVGRALRASR